MTDLELMGRARRTSQAARASMAYDRASNQLDRGSYGAQGERISYSLMDTALLNSATPEHQLMITPQGQPFPGTVVRKSNADTNVTQQGIPANHKVIAKELHVYTLQNASQTDMTAYMAAWVQLLFSTTLNVEIVGKATLGFWTLAQLTGLHNGISGIVTNVANGTPMYSPAWNNYSGFKSLKIPITLAALTGYRFTLKHEVAPAAILNDTKIRIEMAGELRRLA